MLQTPVTLNDIRRVVQQIVERFDPQKVILFGSYADDRPTEDSDVDLLVVMEAADQPLHTAARISAAIDHPFALDIVVSNPSALEASFKRRGNFATEIMTRGVVLYEA
jgi:predicted nucleotidyltransferase